jgi:hypothetical protein
VGYFSEDVKMSIAVTGTAGAAAATAINGTAVDTAGFQGGCCVVQMGPIVTGALTSIKLQQSGDSGGSPDDFTDVLGTSQTIADDADEKVFYIDFKRTTKRYVRVVVTRGTQNATCMAMYYMYGARSKPVTQGTNVTGEQFYAAAEGTA